VQNSEKSSYYQRVLTGELLRTFFLATTRAKVANSGSGKMVIARYRIRYFFQKRAALPLTVLENQLATVARYFSNSLLPSSTFPTFNAEPERRESLRLVFPISLHLVLNLNVGKVFAPSSLFRCI